MKLDAFVDPVDHGTRSFFAKCIGMFAGELRTHLLQEKTRLELDSVPHPEIPDFDRSKHVPTQVVSLMQRRVQRLVAEKKLSDMQHLSLLTDLNAFLDICGACERIKNTPIPWSYTSFIRSSLCCTSSPCRWATSFRSVGIAVPVVMFIF